MNKQQFLKYLILTIMVLPMFYEYFGILPDFAKYLLDGLIILYLLNFKDCINHQSGFTGIYIVYVAIIGLITILSITIHQESVTYFILEIRRLLLPLLLYYIVADVFRSDKDASIHLHKFLGLVLLIQIPITLIQTVFYSSFRQLDLFAAWRYHLDAAAGTIGAGGHSYMGVLIPLLFIYLYDFKLLKYSIPFLIPLVLSNSGGGVVLFGLTIIALVLYTGVSGPIIHRVRIFAGLVLFIGLLISLSQTQFVRQTIRKYTATYFFYQEHYVEGGKETFVGQEHKLSRLNGYRFLQRRMDKYDHEHLFGLGFEFQKNKGSKKPFGFKNDLNTIIAERGFLGLAAYAIFIILFLRYAYGIIKNNQHNQVFVKMLYFGIFFAAGLYNQTSRSILVWFLVIYFLALLEHPQQYQRLQEYLGLRKKRKHARNRSTWVADHQDYSRLGR